MSLSPLSIATHGLLPVAATTALLVAVQGFGFAAAPPPTPAPSGGYVFAMPVDLIEQQRLSQASSDQVLLIVCGLLAASSSS